MRFKAKLLSRGGISPATRLSFDHLEGAESDDPDAFAADEPVPDDIEDRVHEATCLANCQPAVAFVDCARQIRLRHFKFISYRRD